MTSLHDSPLRTVESPGYSESKGQLLLTRRAEGGALIATLS